MFDLKCSEENLKVNRLINPYIISYKSPPNQRWREGSLMGQTSLHVTQNDAVLSVHLAQELVCFPACHSTWCCIVCASCTGTRVLCLLSEGLSLSTQLKYSTAVSVVTSQAAHHLSLIMRLLITRCAWKHRKALLLLIQALCTSVGDICQYPWHPIWWTFHLFATCHAVLMNSFQAVLPSMTSYSLWLNMDTRWLFIQSSCTPSVPRTDTGMAHPSHGAAFEGVPVSWLSNSWCIPHCVPTIYLLLASAKPITRKVSLHKISLNPASTERLENVFRRFPQS